MIGDWNRSVGRTCYTGLDGPPFPLLMRDRRVRVRPRLAAPDATALADRVRPMSEPPPDAEPETIHSPPPPAPMPDDADDTQGAHFRHLIAHPVTLIGTAVLIAVALIVGASQGSVEIGAIAAAAVVVVVLVIVWAIANWGAAEDFYIAYANGRGLARIDGRSTLPPITPLLRKGDSRYAEQRFNGVLPGGMDG